MPTANLIYLEEDTRHFSAIIDEVCAALQDLSQRNRIMKSFAWIADDKRLCDHRPSDIAKYKKVLVNLPNDFKWLDQRPGWYSPRPTGVALSTVRDLPALWIGTAPTLSNAPTTDEADQMARIARRLDAAERDHRNSELERAGEARVVDHERAALLAAGRDDLSRTVRCERGRWRWARL